METPDPTEDARLNLKRLKKIDFSQVEAILWIVHRSPQRADRTYEYYVKRVEADANLQRRLVNVMKDRIERANHVEPYTFESTDQDERVLVHSIDGTDFPQIAAQILAGSDAPIVRSLEELNKAFATVIALSFGKKRELVLGFRKLQNAWNLKKVKTLVSFVFQGPLAVAVDQEAVFKIDRQVDFFAFRDNLLVLNKQQFEAGLNYRRGMEAKRDELFKNFRTLELFSDSKPLEDRCGNNLHYLRKLNSIEKSGYYKNPDFMTKLQEIARKENWGLTFENNKIVPTEESIDEILVCLNNNRLQSLINEERFDVEGTKKPFVRASNGDRPNGG